MIVHPNNIEIVRDVHALFTKELGETYEDPALYTNHAGKTLSEDGYQVSIIAKFDNGVKAAVQGAALAYRGEKEQVLKRGAGYFGLVEYLAVDKDVQGKHYGSKVLAAFEEVMKQMENGLPFEFMMVQAEEDQMGFFEKAGYKQLPVSLRYPCYEVDAEGELTGKPEEFAWMIKLKGDRIDDDVIEYRTLEKTLNSLGYWLSPDEEDFNTEKAFENVSAGVDEVMEEMYERIEEFPDGVSLK
jgi:GNAT superfamily N-acetyltransferase